VVALKVLHDNEKATRLSRTQQGYEPDTVKENSTELRLHTSVRQKTVLHWLALSF